jgi:ribulose-5-phosphate 4-epimerase/fuculose-1-phosphate aldolase
LRAQVGKTALLRSDIEAAAGTSGNISVRADDFSIEGFPQEGYRAKTYHKLDAQFPELCKNRFVITGSGKNLLLSRFSFGKKD